jgi:K+-sensing histidine kinase KdpD
MKTAVRTAARSQAVPGPRARPRALPPDAEPTIVSLELRALEELNQLTSRLLAVADHRNRAPKKSSGARDDFSALVAHELPMMERQLENMARILDDLAVLSRLAEGKLPLARTRVRLADMVSAALQYARPVLAEGGHEVAVTLPTGAVHLHADSSRLAQALGTLLVQGSRRAAREDLLRLTAVVENAELILTVRDHGSHAPRAVASMFGIFPAVEADMGASASGLCVGLALVKALVELHGGSVMAESIGTGRPTMFEIRLPVLPD